MWKARKQLEKDAKQEMATTNMNKTMNVTWPLEENTALFF